jgi:hypothetical protein
MLKLPDCRHDAANDLPCRSLGEGRSEGTDAGIKPAIGGGFAPSMRLFEIFELPYKSLRLKACRSS